MRKHFDAKKPRKKEFSADFSGAPFWESGERHYYRHGGGGGRGGGRGKRFFGRGDVKYALLELLSAAPMHGYQMMKGLEEKSGGLYTPSPGSIYPTLQMLEDRDMVHATEVDGKKVYSITEAGRSFLQERPVEKPRDLVHDSARDILVGEAELQQDLNQLVESLNRLHGESLQDPAKMTRLSFFLKKVRRKLEGHFEEGSDQ
ncbi:PadR family transcriptional regulator [Brevibacillus choshinensis]|uniref:PadR family transcriptional regulator n=1 Tax=Brevibacillus choshinensis TaxID=54911 RepID=A0ABX7FP30_BRECH|nr:PadR family transcriptional regulator [Brevibacillus choshinensis]QRG67590.1 PadR family transcriptional regulator [Brevibacillus choshinensis]